MSALFSHRGQPKSNQSENIHQSRKNTISVSLEEVITAVPKKKRPGSPEVFDGRLFGDGLITWPGIAVLQ